MADITQLNEFFLQPVIAHFLLVFRQPYQDLCRRRS